MNEPKRVINAIVARGASWTFETPQINTRVFPHSGGIAPHPKSIIAGFYIPLLFPIFVPPINKPRVVASPIHVLTKGVIVVVGSQLPRTGCDRVEIIPPDLAREALPHAHFPREPSGAVVVRVRVVQDLLPLPVHLDVVPTHRGLELIRPPEELRRARVITYVVVGAILLFEDHDLVVVRLHHVIVVRVLIADHDIGICRSGGKVPQVGTYDSVGKERTGSIDGHIVAPGGAVGEFAAYNREARTQDSRPLGACSRRCWSHLGTDAAVLVFPRRQLDRNATQAPLQEVLTDQRRRKIECAFVLA
jgi:hypothetical protein